MEANRTGGPTSTGRLEAEGGDPEAGWSLWARVRTQVKQPGNEEAIMSRDAQGDTLQFVGRYEDLPNLLWLLGIGPDVEFDRVKPL